MVTHEVQPLPRGRHGIDRDEIRANQRARIMDATIECVAERGYAPTTVGHIVSQARVSRETFYTLFPDKAACYQEALHATSAAITAAFAEATSDTSQPHLVRIERGLRGYFDVLAARPTLTACFILERPTERAAQSQDRMSNAEIARTYADVYGNADPFVVEAYLAMIEGVVRSYVINGRTADLPGCLDELMPVVARVLQLDS